MSLRLKDALKRIFSRSRRVAPDQQHLTTQSSLLRYGVAMLAVGLAVLFKLLLDPIIVQETPFRLIIGAVVVSAWYGGLGPGLLATVTGGLIADYFFLPPTNSFSGLSMESVPLVLFLLEGLLINWIVVALRHARQRAEVNTRKVRSHQESLRESESRYRSVIEQAAENIFMVDVKTKRVLESNAALQTSLGYTAEELLRMTLYDVVDHDRESVDHNVDRALTEGQSFLGERRYRCRDGSLIEVEVHVSVITFAGRQTMSIVAHDVTERKRAQQSLKHALDRLLALYEASETLGSTLESEEIISRLLAIIQRVSHLTAAVISVPEEGGSMRVWRSIGVEELWPRALYAAEPANARWAALKTEEPQLFRLQSADHGIEPLVGLCLPLPTRDHSLGVLEAYGQEALAEDDAIELLTSLASHAGTALDNARLYGELADREQRLRDLVEKLLVAQEEERRHVAYEVHDGLAQVAVAAHKYLDAFARRYTGDDTQGRKKLDRALELIQQTVREARYIIANLRPTVLDDFGLATALRLQVEEFRSEDCETVYEEALGGNDEARLPVAVETALFRVAQEALTNIKKHAQSPRVCVRLERRNGIVRLEVRDWGRGFEPGKGMSKGGPGERVGLVGMEERITLLGGDLKVHSEPGAGTSIVAEVPLPEEYTEND